MTTPTKLTLLTKLANNGDPKSQYELGGIYRGRREAEYDIDESIKWYKESAKNGYYPAQRNLGIIYSLGNDVEIDHKEAAKWFEKGHSQGCEYSKCALGVMHYYGDEVDQDIKKGIRWIREVAMLDPHNHHPQDILATIHTEITEIQTCLTVPLHGLDDLLEEMKEVTYGESIMWWRTLANQGNDDAQEYLDNLFKINEETLGYLDTPLKDLYPIEDTDIPVENK